MHCYINTHDVVQDIQTVTARQYTDMATIQTTMYQVELNPEKIAKN